MVNIDSIYIAPEHDGSFWLWGQGEYEDYSVLAGQTFQRRMMSGTLVECQAYAKEHFPTMVLPVSEYVPLTREQLGENPHQMDIDSPDSILYRG